MDTPPGMPPGEFLDEEEVILDVDVQKAEATSRGPSLRKQRPLRFKKARDSLDARSTRVSWSSSKPSRSRLPLT